MSASRYFVGLCCCCEGFPSLSLLGQSFPLPKCWPSCALPLSPLWHGPRCLIWPLPTLAAILWCPGFFPLAPASTQVCGAPRFSPQFGLRRVLSAVPSRACYGCLRIVPLPRPARHVRCKRGLSWLACVCGSAVWVCGVELVVHCGRSHAALMGRPQSVHGGCWAVRASGLL